MNEFTECCCISNEEAHKILKEMGYEAKIQELEQKLKEREWISVKDRLPEIDCLYIVCRTIYPHQIVFEASWENGKWLSVVTSNQLEYITHWMPLPNPPKEDDEE